MSQRRLFSLARPTRLSSLVLACLGLAACSLLTKPEQGPIKCTVSEEPGALDPCPKDMVCVDSTCRPEVSCATHEICGDHEDNDCDDKIDEFDETKAEFCNLEDDDCDGEVDEGYDQDMDGVTSCGDPTHNSAPDCEPNNSTVNPNADEICDGADNDCDGKTDEFRKEAPLCDDREFCAGRCQARTCAVAGSGVVCKAQEKCLDSKCVLQNCSPPCLAREYCDQNFTCMPVPQRPNGGPCATNDDCLPTSSCIDTAALNLPATTQRGVCTKACCSSAECEAGEVCFASGTGARSCVPKTLVDNTVKPLCVVGSDCPSQVCAAGENMLTGAVSRKIGTTICHTRTSTERPFAEACSFSSSCETKLCVPGNILGPDLCSTPCRTSSDCLKLEMAAKGIITQPKAYCEYVNLGDYMSMRDNFAPFCLVIRDERGTATPGASCKTTSDCADGACIGASSESPGRCAPTCCNDMNCTVIGPNVRCLPTARGTGRFEMRCIARD